MKINRAIYFDMDGTIANFYGVENWLGYLLESNPFPYEVAKPLVNMNALARRLNNLQKKGWTIGVVSWLAKNSTKEFDEKVVEAKKKWLAKHLASVKFDEINIVPYGTPKSTVPKVGNAILFDDEENNLIEWEEMEGWAFTPDKIMEILTWARGN